MKQILQKEELIKRIDTCLQMTSLPRDIYEPYIARPFQTSGFFDDLSPYIQIDPSGYILIQYEPWKELTTHFVQSVDYMNSGIMKEKEPL